MSALRLGTVQMDGLRRAEARENLRESSRSWQGFKWDRSEEDEYNMDMTKISFYTAPQNHNRFTSEPSVILLEHASTCNREMALPQFKMFRIALICGS